MTSLDPRQATDDYLAWLGSEIPLIAEDLKAKAKAMAGDPLRFLRGSYYLWLLRAGEEIPEVAAAPLVVAVGDAHVENFGIWLDADRRRVWGVNDYDEIGLAPYALDLVRTVASALVSAEVEGGLRLHGPALAELMIEGWVQGLDDPSERRLDGGDHPHLTALAPALDGAKFWDRIQSAPNVDSVPDPAAALVAAGGLDRPDWRRRQAGTGSLGHRRLVALGSIDDARSALEVKELGPPTASWPPLHALTTGWAGTSEEAWKAVSAMPGFPPEARRLSGWVMRRLGPESGRIELTALGRRRDESALVRSMGRALGAVHAAGPTGMADARRHAESWGPRGLLASAEAMAARVRHDFQHSA